MFDWLKDLLGRFADANDLGRDVKIVAFGGVVLAAVVWLSVDLRHGITDEWTDAFMILMASCSVGGAAWSAVDAWGSRRENAKPTQQGTGKQDQEGQP